MMKLRAALAVAQARMPYVRRLSRDIRASKITFVSRRKLRRLAQAVFLARMAAPKGIYIEAGVALGGTAVLIGLLKSPDRALYLYDVFGMIPPPSENDAPDAVARYEVIASGKAEGIGGETYYGYRPDIKQQVEANLQRFGVDPATRRIKLIEGAFEETLNPAEPVAFAHIDCDWYDSVMTCIQRIWPLMLSGGVMLFDDYRSYDGCKKAVDQFIAEATDCQVLFSDVSLAVVKR